jgi:outer membrane lipoprotein-sorting protein
MLHKSKKFGIGVMALMVLAFVAVVAAAPAVTAAAEKATTGQSVVKTIKGTVVELAKNKQGVVIKVGIKTAEEGNYRVSKNDKGPELLTKVGKTVKATGPVHTSRGKLYIDVTEYEVME